MLTKIIIAGLIPGMVAKPIMLAKPAMSRPDTSAAHNVSNAGASAAHHNATSTSSALSSWPHTAKMVFSTAAAAKRDDDDLADVAANFGFEAAGVGRREPAQGGSYPVVALPSVAPSFSVLTLPASLPTALPSKAVEKPPVQPAVDFYPVVKPLTSAALSSSLVQLPYNVKTPAAAIEVPTLTPAVIPTSFPVQLPYHVKTPSPVIEVPTSALSAPVLPYSIRTPAVQPVIPNPTYPVVAPPSRSSASSRTVPLPSSIGAPAVQPEIPVSATAVQPQLAYGVKTPVVQPEIPFSAAVAELPYSVKTPAVQPELSYGVKTLVSQSIALSATAVQPELPYGVKTPVAQPELPYGVKAPAVQPEIPYGVKTPAFQSIALSATAVQPELPYGVKTPIAQPELPYGVKAPAVQPEIPFSATVAELPYGIKTPVAELPYGVKTPVVEVPKATYPSGAQPSTLIPVPYDSKTQSAAASSRGSAVPSHVPSAKTDPIVPSGSSVCAQQCEVKCQTAHIATDVTQCRSSCLSGCVAGSSGGVLVGSAENRKDKAKGAAVVPTVPNVPGVPGTASRPFVGVGSVTYESCMQSCNGKWQHADIAGDVSTGKENCKAACAQYSSSGTGVVIKRKFKDLVPPEPVIGAGADTYETCMQGCVARWHNAAVGCQERCAASSGFGASVIVKKAVEEAPADIKRDVKDFIPTGPVAGVGHISYEACMQSCNGKWQHADIAGDMSTGKDNCQSACARYAAKGAGVIVKKAVQPTPPAPPAKPFSQPATPIVGVGHTSYDACMEDCSSKYQSAHIAMDISQGKYSCKQACAHLEANGVGVIAKK
ncbi:hypothetical protein EKO27_g11013 [Xylaria grammica]|uniref:WSC domain-containing protein n=1 Tax=Xylaria grammica TaxID=363999 RepID=A0A439CPK6_9PEZI|nr:hypothetical protein EKO27_g11013 [Xylaria grammica]